MKKRNIPTIASKKRNTEIAPNIKLTSVIKVLMNEPVETPSDLAKALSPVDVV